MLPKASVAQLIDGAGGTEGVSPPGILQEAHQSEPESKL